MSISIKKLALAAVTLSGLSLAALSIASAPAEARVLCDRDGDDCRQVPDWNDRYNSNVVCDEDGDDCRRVRGWYGRGDYDDDWRWRHAQEEQREHSRTYWSAPYYQNYGYQRSYGGWSGY